MSSGGPSRFGSVIDRWIPENAATLPSAWERARGGFIWGQDDTPTRSSQPRQRRTERHVSFSEDSAGEAADIDSPPLEVDEESRRRAAAHRADVISVEAERAAAAEKRHSDMLAERASQAKEHRKQALAAQRRAEKQREVEAQTESRQRAAAARRREAAREQEQAAKQREAHARQVRARREEAKNYLHRTGAEGVLARLADEAKHHDEIVAQHLVEAEARKKAAAVRRQRLMAEKAGQAEEHHRQEAAAERRAAQSQATADDTDKLTAKLAAAAKRREALAAERVAAAEAHDQHVDEVRARRSEAKQFLHSAGRAGVLKRLEEHAAEQEASRERVLAEAAVKREAAAKRHDRALAERAAQAKEHERAAAAAARRAEQDAAKVAENARRDEAAAAHRKELAEQRAEAAERRDAHARKVRERRAEARRFLLEAGSRGVVARLAAHAADREARRARLAAENAVKEAHAEHLRQRQLEEKAAQTPEKERQKRAAERRAAAEAEAKKEHEAAQAREAAAAAKREARLAEAAKQKAEHEAQARAAANRATKSPAKQESEVISPAKPVKKSGVISPSKPVKKTEAKVEEAAAKGAGAGVGAGSSASSSAPATPKQAATAARVKALVEEVLPGTPEKVKASILHHDRYKSAPLRALVAVHAPHCPESVLEDSALAHHGVAPADGVLIYSLFHQFCGNTADKEQMDASKFRKFVREAGFSRPAAPRSRATPIASNDADEVFAEVSHDSAVKLQFGQTEESGSFAAADTVHTQTLDFAAFRDANIEIAQRMFKKRSKQGHNHKESSMNCLLDHYLMPLAQREGRRLLRGRQKRAVQGGLGEPVEGEEQALTDAGLLSVLKANKAALHALFTHFSEQGHGKERRARLRGARDSMDYEELVDFAVTFGIIPDVIDADGLLKLFKVVNVDNDDHDDFVDLLSPDEFDRVIARLALRHGHATTGNKADPKPDDSLNTFLQWMNNSEGFNRLGQVKTVKRFSIKPQSPSKKSGKSKKRSRRRR